jgi:hypothetical protein
VQVADPAAALRELETAAREVEARGLRRMQNGLLRTYVFFLGTGMAVLAIVFLLTK